ncbi:MAG: extracellular solute-binding protein [Pararhizobium sp.]
MKLKLVLAAAVAVGGLTAAAHAASDSLTIVSWGGAYSMSQNEAYDKPFTKKTGVQIQHVDKSASGLSGIRSQVEAKNVSWNIVDLLQSDAQRACDEGLVMQIKPDEWMKPAPDGKPASEDFVKGTIGDCFIPEILYSTVFAYNTRAFPNGGPQTIKDIWDLKKFPGKRALQKIPQKNLEWALIADGVPADQVYKVLATKEGQDRAFKSLDKIKKDVIWWDEGAQPPQMLADTEAVIATAFNGRIFDAAQQEHQPFDIMWDKQMFEVDGWVIPVGQPEDKMKLIKDYIKFSTDTQRLADQAQYISYGPARESSTPLVGKYHGTDIDMKQQMPTRPDRMKEAVMFNANFWADYGDALEERFNTWLAQ